MSGYPRLIWLKDGRERTVHTESEELALVAEGVYTRPVPVVSEPVTVEEPAPAPVSDPYDTEPTFGPPGDDTHAKRPAKGKKR